MKKKGIRLLVIAALFCLLLGAACHTLFIAPLQNRDTWVYKEAVVERGNLAQGVSESGALEYGIREILYDLDLDTDDEDENDEDEDEEDEETARRYLKVEEVYVAPGQRISAGDPLIKFTNDSAEGVRRLLESALVDAKSAYSEAEAEYELAVLEAKTDYESRKVSQGYAETVHKYAESAIDDEIDSLQVEIDRRTANTQALEEKTAEAREDYDEALADYQAAKETMDITGTENTVNFMTVQSEYLSAQNKYRSAQAALEQAEEKLTENARQLERLRLQLTAAREKRAIDQLDAGQSRQESVTGGENAEAAYNATLESLKEELAEARAEVEEAQERLDALTNFIGDDGILYSDGEGIVTQVGYESGDILRTEGTAVSYASPEDMTISVDVTQEDVVTMFVGDKVDITFTAYPDTPYKGEILSIDTTATSRTSSTISYKVVVGVEGDTGKLYGGMTADIMFVTEEKEDVLYVSKKAVVEQDGKKWVYVPGAAGGKELKEVQTGLSNSLYTEIVSGLEEGDVIYIASRVSSEAEVEGGGEAAEDGQPSETPDLTGEFSLPDGAAQPDGAALPDGNADFEYAPAGSMGGAMEQGGRQGTAGAR